MCGGRVSENMGEDGDWVESSENKIITDLLVNPDL